MNYENLHVFGELIRAFFTNPDHWLVLGILLLVWLSGAVITFFGTWALYVAIMYAKAKEQQILNGHWSVRWAFLYVLLPLGLISDTALNWWTMPVIFWEMPKECLTTARVTRLKYNDYGWRGERAIWWCENWLELFDKDHCKKST